MSESAHDQAERKFLQYNTASCDHNPHGRCDDCVAEAQIAFYAVRQQTARECAEIAEAAEVNEVMTTHSTFCHFEIRDKIRTRYGVKG